jgi:AcrR family transcriptional regulator
MALAAEGGLEDLTLDAIAARAGVGRPTIYRRWPSKDALLEEAIEKISDKYGVVPHSGNVRDDLIEWATLAIEQMQGPLRVMWLAYFNLDEAHLAPDAVKRTKDRTVDIVRRAIERGELRSNASPELLIEMIFASIWYQVTVRHRQLDSAFATTVVDALVDGWRA